MRLTGLLFALVLSLLCALGAARAQSPSAQPSTEDAGPLVVAVREVPPFAMKRADGGWTGLSVDLWQAIAAREQRAFEYRELSLGDTWDALERGDADLAIAALSITSQREQRFDFSHPYLVSGIAAAYRSQENRSLIDTVRAFVSPQFLTAVGSLSLVLLAAGVAVWLFERRRNAAQFGEGHLLRGLGDGFWWSAVTMTTVGYGDKSPVTFGGRVVALIWMFMSMIIVASFTASIAASLTAERIGGDSLRDKRLSELSVGVLENSAAMTYVMEQGADARRFEALDQALERLDAHDIDVVVHDAPILQYLIAEGDYAAEVAQRMLVRDDYGFAFAQDSALRDPINQTMLSILVTPAWRGMMNRYLGIEQSGP